MKFTRRRTFSITKITAKQGRYKSLYQTLHNKKRKKNYISRNQALTKDFTLSKLCLTSKFPAPLSDQMCLKITCIKEYKASISFKMYLNHLGAKSFCNSQKIILAELILMIKLSSNRLENNFNVSRIELANPVMSRALTSYWECMARHSGSPVEIGIRNLRRVESLLKGLPNSLSQTFHRKSSPVHAY